MPSIPVFSECHALLQAQEPTNKVIGLSKLYKASLEDRLHFDWDYPIDPQINAGLPLKLYLVAPNLVPRRKFNTEEGRAIMVHAIAHIEYNAINIALDAIYRFRGMPSEYYLDWLKVAREEAYHFDLLTQHLQKLGYEYGDFPAHNGLWEMTQKTGYDVLARMALVPRLLEARGLDVTPDIAKKLRQAGDRIAAEILSIIYYDEIQHVALGNRWYHYLCQQRALEPIEAFAALLHTHAPDFLRGPFARTARILAGFSENELIFMNNFVQGY